jgi:hypothetical protein
LGVSILGLDRYRETWPVPVFAEFEGIHGWHHVLLVSGAGVLIAGIVLLLCGRARPDTHLRRVGVAVASRVQRRGAWTIAFGCVFVALALNGNGLDQYLRTKGPDDKFNQGQVALGLRLRAATGKDASIATIAAGAVAYYSHRDIVDVLGKSDRVIARLPGTGPFIPGHNKFDLNYSIGSLRPT